MVRFNVCQFRLGDLDQTYDLGLGAEFAIHEIATHAAAYDGGTEADFSSEAILEDLERLKRPGPGL
jgi:hypothetical protein